MLNLKLVRDVHASGGGGANSRSNARNPAGQVVRGAGQQRRGRETMSAYYRRTGVSALGGNARTRGRAATITPTRG